MLFSCFSVRRAELWYLLEVIIIFIIIIIIIIGEPG